jgi:hypothetical protein
LKKRPAKAHKGSRAREEEEEDKDEEEDPNILLGALFSNLSTYIFPLIGETKFLTHIKQHECEHLSY